MNRYRAIFDLLKIIFLGLCPSCLKDSIFNNIVILKKECPNCSEDFSKYNLGDADNFFVILIVGIIIMCGLILTEINYKPSLYTHIIIWIPATIILSIIFTRPIKSFFLYIGYELRRNQKDI
ncbi:MAG: DUF983 domain-containing protein [Hyphomicrobiales bacterium]|nr:DUF983 domain-containing protein [Hyphomicrobiales bacterium]